MPLITNPGSCPAPPCQSISILLAASRPGLAVVRPDLSLPGRRAGVRERPRPLDVPQRRGEITEVRRDGSGRKALAAFRAPRCQHPAAARRSHSRTKAVAALADEPARLVSALHGTLSNGNCLG